MTQPRSNAAEDLGDNRPVREAALLFGAMFLSGIVMTVLAVWLVFNSGPQLQKSVRHPDAYPTRAGVEPGRTNVITRPPSSD